MSEGFIKKFKDWMSVEEEYEDDDFEGEESVENMQDDSKLEPVAVSSITKGSKVVNIHTNSQMKVVIVEPKK